MAAAATDLLQEVGLPGSATTLAGSGYTVGDTSITVEATTNHPTATGYTFAMDVVETDAEGNQVRVEGTYCEFVGVVTSATTIGSLERVFGDPQNYAAGANTRVYVPVSSERENRIVEWGLVEHKQDGSHSAVTADSLTVTDTLTLPAGSVETADIADSAITPAKVNLSSTTAYIDTSESTTSTVSTDLTTVGPSVTVTVPANGRLTVSFASSINSASTAQAGRVAFVLSGANTRAAQDNEAIETQGIFVTCSRTVSLTGLTPGSTTVKMVYVTTSAASAATFRRRSLTVIPGL